MLKKLKLRSLAHGRYAWSGVKKFSMPPPISFANRINGVYLFCKALSNRSNTSTNVRHNFTHCGTKSICSLLINCVSVIGVISSHLCVRPDTKLKRFVVQVLYIEGLLKFCSICKSCSIRLNSIIWYRGSRLKKFCSC